MSDTFEVVSRYDEAIDAEAVSPTDREKYKNTGDMSLLRFIEGEKPTRFYCRRLKGSEMVTVREQISESGMFAAAFARGLVKATGVRRENGERRDWARGTDQKVISSKELDELFDFGDVQEIGALIYGKSILGKGRPAVWPQPATSRLAVEGLVFRRAVQIIERDAASAQTKSEAGTEPTPAP